MACPIVGKLIRSSFRQPSLNYYAGYFLLVCWYYDRQLAFLTVTSLSDLGSFQLPQHSSLVPGGWFFPFHPNLTCGIFWANGLVLQLSTLQHECTHSTYPHSVVFPIAVFNFHQLIYYPTVRDVGISLSVFLVASVEQMIPVCLCIGEVVSVQCYRYLATSPEAAASRPNTQSELSRILPVRLILRFCSNYCIVLLVFCTSKIVVDWLLQQPGIDVYYGVLFLNICLILLSFHFESFCPFTWM